MDFRLIISVYSQLYNHILIVSSSPINPTWKQNINLYFLNISPHCIVKTSGSSLELSYHLPIASIISFYLLLSPLRFHNNFTVFIHYLYRITAVTIDSCNTQFLRIINISVNKYIIICYKDFYHTFICR